MNQDYLESKVNPPRHGGNIFYKHLDEAQQQEILAYAQLHGVTKAGRNFSISDDRVRRIFTKYGAEVPTRKPKGQRLPASAKAMLEKLTQTDFKGRLHPYSYMGHVRTVTGYSVDDEQEEYVLILHTRTANGVERDVKYAFREAQNVVNDFVRWDS